MSSGNDGRGKLPCDSDNSSKPFLSRRYVAQYAMNKFPTLPQGCAPRATLGKVAESGTTLKGVSSSGATGTMGSTLSGLAHILNPAPRVARFSQPWAGGWNAVGVRRTFHAIRPCKSYDKRTRPGGAVLFALGCPICPSRLRLPF